MAGLAPVELSADCPACGLEGGVVEIYDALVAPCRFGLPATTRCKLCAASSAGHFDRTPAKALREIPANRCPGCLHELGPSALDERCCSVCSGRATLRDLVSTTRFETIADLERALDAWAERDGFPSRQALAGATFVEPDIALLFAALQRNEPLAVLADPFANMGVRTTGRSSEAKTKAASSTKEVSPPPTHAASPTPPTTPEAPIRIVPRGAPQQRNPFASTLQDEERVRAPTELREAAQPRVPSAPPPPSAPPRAIVFPLVSVIAADGEIHPEERALVDRFLQSEGLAPLADHEFAVHHPSEVAHFVPRERREEVVKLMCETAAIDGLPDESERRVIRAYATAWHVDDEKLDFWMWGYESMNTSIARQLFLKLRRFVLSGRWGESDKSE
jgi:uncharacterized tellurite resistance protein B-like protein